MTEKKNRTDPFGLDDGELDFDFLSRTAERKADPEDTQMSLTEMIDQLTLEASENTQTAPISDFGDLVPKFTVEMEDDDEPEARGFHFAVLIPVILVILILGGVFIAVSHSRPAADTPENEPGGRESAVIDVTPDPDDKVEPDSAMASLRREITEITETSEGVWSVYVKNLSTDESFTINNVQMSSASVIKLFTAGRYLEMIDSGELEETEASEYDLYAMICWSDNDAWVELETIIGYGDYTTGLMSVTDFAARHGYEKSGRLIGGETIYDEEADNRTTAAETGRLLEEIYEGTFVSAAASQHLYDLLYEQCITYKIPAGLPEGFEFASKSGELPGVENDAAIIKGTDTDYILTVFGNEIFDSEYAADVIVRISRLCALSLNPSVSES